MMGQTGQNKGYAYIRYAAAQVQLGINPIKCFILKQLIKINLTPSFNFAIFEDSYLKFCDSSYFPISNLMHYDWILFRQPVVLEVLKGKAILEIRDFVLLNDFLYFYFIFVQTINNRSLYSPKTDFVIIFFLNFY